VAAGLLATLKPTGITGLAIAPDSIRYLYSTRPLTTIAQFSGARIRINDSATTGEVLRALGATPVTDIRVGPATVQALRDGTLTAVESNPYSAMENGYVQVAPYVVVNVPLFAKTTTFAVNSAQLARLPARDADWLRLAAQQAAATEATSATDRASWGALCGQGLKPLALTGPQLTALQNGEAPTYNDLASNPPTALAVNRIGGLATTQPRMDTWATCHGVGVAGSPTKVLDGTYEFTITQAAAAASGLGDAGTGVVVIHDGRYAGHGVGPPSTPGNPNDPNVAFFKAWLPGDPSEVGTVSITGNQVTFVPETSQPQGSVPTTATFELFNGLLTWHLLSGQGIDGNPPWRKLS
jgi:hypothetical protein